MRLGKILIPIKPRVQIGIMPGSAMVAMTPVLSDSDYFRVYYEGNAFGASNLNRFEEKLITAAGRAATRYPTTAMQGHPIAEKDTLYVEIGTFIYDLNEKPAIKCHLNPEKKSLLREWAPDALENYRFVYRDKKEPDTWLHIDFEDISMTGAIASMEKFVQDMALDGIEIEVDHPVRRYHNSLKEADILSLVQHRSKILNIVFDNKVFSPDDTMDHFARSLGGIYTY